ncbi:hypothetical protein D9M71_659370 [compost metagenome]
MLQYPIQSLRSAQLLGVHVAEEIQERAVYPIRIAGDPASDCIRTFLIDLAEQINLYVIVQHLTETGCVKVEHLEG